MTSSPSDPHTTEFFAAGSSASSAYASSGQGDQAQSAFSQSVSPGQPPSKSARMRTIVWGLVLMLLGLIVIAVGAGINLNLSLALIGVIALAGLVLLVGAIASIGKTD